MATKTTLTGADYKTRRAEAETRAGYGQEQKDLIRGANTETITSLVYDHLLVGNLDEAKSLIRALNSREVANRLTFHP